ARVDGEVHEELEAIREAVSETEIEIEGPGAAGALVGEVRRSATEPEGEEKSLPRVDLPVVGPVAFGRALWIRRLRRKRGRDLRVPCRLRRRGGGLHSRGLHTDGDGVQEHAEEEDPGIVRDDDGAAVTRRAR